MDIEEFLEKHVEGYLFSDLETMARIELQSPRTNGAVVFPMVATALAGMELLGAILSNNKFTTNSTTTNFYEYWNKFLVEVDTRYKGHAPLVWKLIRNGLAHAFLTKPCILITKGNPTEHLQIGDEQLTIDAIRLYEDFKKSYEELVKPIFSGSSQHQQITRDQAQRRLEEMIAEYSNEAQQFFDTQAGSPLTANATPAATSGSYFIGSLSAQRFNMSIHIRPKCTK